MDVKVTLRLLIAPRCEFEQERFVFAWQKHFCTVIILHLDLFYLFYIGVLQGSDVRDSTTISPPLLTELPEDFDVKGICVGIPKVNVYYECMNLYSN